MGLLVRAFALLYARTNRQEYLDMAESLYHRAVNSSPAVWSNTLAHKLGWAAYSLWVITHKSDYVEDACRMADRITSLQQSDGGFDYPEFWPKYDQAPLDLKCNIGAQFATWVSYARMLLSLSKEPAR
jgi:hypothetical protein